MPSPDVHPQVRSHVLWWLECTLCGVDSYAGNIARFASEADMWAVMLGECGWSRRDDGRVLCRWHGAVADCDAEGHQLTLWVEHPIEAELDWRFCARCGAQFAQRIAGSPGTFRAG
jgi:hypothetical protein